MKKGLLFTFNSIFLCLFYVALASAQQTPDDLNTVFSPLPDFDYNIEAEHSNPDGTLSSGNLTSNAIQNGISMTLVGFSISLETSSNPTSTKIAALSSNSRYIVLESDPGKDIRKVAYLMRADGNNRSSAITLEYSSDNGGSFTALPLIPTGANSALGDPEGNLPSPGKYHLIDLPANTNYVRIKREDSQARTTRVYRVIASSTDFTLPLDFLSFTAKANVLGKSVSLNWQTTNEVNTKEFIIEKRTDATEFEAIGTEASNNTAGIHNYNYTDNNVATGTAYYRLKQVDNDGKYKYSDIQTVKIESGISLSIYPNPTDGILNVTHEPAKQASVKVLALDGKTVISQSITEGETSTGLNVSVLGSGAYLVVYDNAGQQSTLKFIKK